VTASFSARHPPGAYVLALPSQRAMAAASARSSAFLPPSAEKANHLLIASPGVSNRNMIQLHRPVRNALKLIRSCPASGVGDDMHRPDPAENPRTFLGRESVDLVVFIEQLSSEDVQDRSLIVRKGCVWSQAWSPPSGPREAGR
jgi:hypothetical protein